MSDIPRKAVSRTAKLAALPLGFAGRTVLGLGKRTIGRPAEAVALEIQRRTADQMFAVLGELKGGAMKVGQVMSIFEAGLPDELSATLRAGLTRLQEAAPPMPSATTRRVMADSFGPGWRERFTSFDESPAAAASIGQVHRAVWHDGRDVAVKVQYPGARDALMSDFRQMSRLGRIIAPLFPALDLKPVIEGLRERLEKELDYADEARLQNVFHEAFRDDPDYVIPAVVAQSGGVLVTEWLDGTPLAEVIAGTDQEDRDRAGLLLFRFLLVSRVRCDLIHVDPHPGNFRLMPDGRLGVLDFGGAAEVPPDLQRSIARLLRIGTAGTGEDMIVVAEQEGLLRPGSGVDPRELEAFMAPQLAPLAHETFRFTRAWLKEVTTGSVSVATDLRPGSLARKLGLPPAYLPLALAMSACEGVLCQLEAEAPYRAEAVAHLPGFADEPV
ncbi:AarF/ABC1/UbiB kinase family protein [Actinocorallia longicatena]|uniref:AarF/ABC1/UbiB kinase family protein n=1 Tax=Actinocorallia longicatena TaxID=111803 RepID=A0ABP6QFP2_9ACTN